MRHVDVPIPWPAASAFHSGPTEPRQGYQPPQATRAFGLAGTFSIYVAILGLFFWLQHMTVTPIAPASHLAVSFELAPIPVAPPAQPTDVPPGPAQNQQEASKASHAKDPPTPPPIPSPTSLSLPLPATTISGETADDASSDRKAVEQTTAPPAVQSPATSVAARATSASSEQAALANWQGQLLGHLKTFLRYPRQAEHGRQQGVTLVVVTVDRQGRVLSARIDRSSGYPILDNEAIATARRGSPVPPPTADIRGDPVSVTIPIQFSLRR